MFENITAYILGVLIAVLPAGDHREAGERMEKDLRLDRVRVVAEKQEQNDGRLSWETLRVVVKPWETDAGTAGKAVWEFSAVEAVMAAGEWKLESVGGATVTLAFDEDDLGSSVAAKQGVGISGVWIEGGELYVKGAFRTMMAMVPIEFEINGKPVLKDNSIIMGAEGETSVFRIAMGGAVREYIIEAINPMVRLEEFDVISSHKVQYEKYVGETFRFEAGSMEVGAERLVVEFVIADEDDVEEDKGGDE